MSTKFEVIGLGASTVDMLSLVDRFPCREEVQEAHEITVQGGGPVATAMVRIGLPLNCQPSKGVLRLRERRSAASTV